jgi:Arc/MetJ-type ribon-helix-helix transcriptional regulator
MEIRLSPELEAAVSYGIASGRYANAEEYFAKAIELLHERDAWPEESLEEQRAGLEAAWQEAERGELTSLDDVRREMEEMKRAWTATR